MLGLSDAYCVQYLQTFQAMSWRYKLLDISSETAPLVATFIAWANRHEGRWDGWWVAFAALFWLGSVVTISKYIRGYLAQKCGVEPAPREPKSSEGANRVIMIMLGAGAFFLFLVPLVNSIRHGFQNAGSGDLLGGIYLIFFTQQLSTYARNRYSDAAPERASIESV